MFSQLVLLSIALSAFAASAQDTNSLSVMIEAAGRVEFNPGGSTNWQAATVGLALKPGDRVRTREQSRAAVQLSDRSVIRLNELTTLEILPPRRAEKKRFGLPGGSIYFFNREKPADVEFDTPLAAGAIRGTEFLLEVTDARPTLHLALIDGLVSLQTADAEVNLQRGEDLRLAPNQPPQKTALVNVNAAIQWALYYPAVVNLAELPLDANDRNDLAEVLNNYRAGDLLAALAAWPSNQSETTAGWKIFRAQLELAVGGVNEAERLLDGVSGNQPTAAALRELIRIVLGNTNASTDLRAPASASQLLARSYALQARAELEAARATATQAVQLAPEFGFAHARLAELDFAFGNRRAALAELDIALRLSPKLAPAHSLRGFVLLAQGDVRAAMNAFDRARALDAAFGLAWLGRGLCLMQERKFPEALCAFQAAAALEPQRSLYRSYLGKASSELGNTRNAQKEFNLAKGLDPNDPTPWLYSALDLWQQNRLNEAIRDLEKSIALNDQLTPFRSRLLLDGDRSVRSADIAAIYDDVGLPEVNRHTAAQSVAEDYANFSGHLFLANSYQTIQDANQYDLRLETARQSELLVANLLAPPGAGNLSQLFSQQEHLQYFDPRPVGISSFTGYGSGGDWVQTVTMFGSLDGFSYALDYSYQTLNGQQPNGSSLNRQYIATMKQRVTPDDDIYFQVGYFQSNAGDVALHYNPLQTTPGFHVEEKQDPTLYAGWHHEWSPGSHTLLLAGRLNDNL
jgi:Flp pilus assembly protein TadD